MEATAITMETILADVGTVVSTIVEVGGTVINFIGANPLCLLPVGFTVVSYGIGFVRGLIHQ